MKNMIRYSLILAVFAFVGLAFNVASADCTLSYGQALSAYHGGDIRISMSKTSSTRAAVTIQNNTGCSFPAKVPSYKVYSNEISAPQTLISVLSRTIPAHTSYTFSAELASCLTQVDAYYDGPGAPTDHYEWAGKIFGIDGRVFGDIPSAEGMFCTANTPYLSGSCSVSPSSAETNTSVTWSASASGGTGSYTYSWTGTNGLSGSGKSVSKAYTTSGSKTGTVTITSGSQSVVKSCTATITDPEEEDLVASCSVSPSSVEIGDSVTWSASAFGGTGSYAYSWTGTNGLSGSGKSVSKAYTTSGSKTGTVTVTSGTKSASATCTSNVTETADSDLSVSCYTTKSYYNIDDDVYWYASVSGGDGDYEYDWSGTDSLNGDEKKISWSYDDSGTKKAKVTVTSNGETVTSDYCSVRIEDDEDYNDLSVSCYASPKTADVGEKVYWYARATGGDGDYDYEWSGTDDLDGSSRSIHTVYDTAGTKTARVRVESGDGQTDTYTCKMTVNSVLSYTDSAVYLSQIPYTGVSDKGSSAVFIIILSFLSAWVAYVVIERKKEIGEIKR